ncbi:hypothetical protein A2U01_0078468, partial [Trifolium medium]|nr:hypothetical protein [Trifolium medium]
MQGAEDDKMKSSYPELFL